MWFVYVLKSRDHSFIYIGRTDDVEKTLKEHNEGINRSTNDYAPFVLEAYVAVPSETQAVELEKYFKTDPGKVLLKRRILTEPTKRSLKRTRSKPAKRSRNGWL